MTPTEITVPSCTCREIGCVIPFGHCHCGCGEKVSVTKNRMTVSGFRYESGSPMKFVLGHNSRNRPSVGQHGRSKKYYGKLKSLGLCRRCRNTASGKAYCPICAKEYTGRAKEKRNKSPKTPNLKKVKRCVVCDLPVIQGGLLCDEHRFKTCPQCGEKFSDSGRGRDFLRRKFCSCKCRGDAYTGVNAPRWTGGIRCRQRTRIEAQESDRWRREVKKRDQFTCQDCGTKEGRMHAHHIKEYAKYPELRLDVRNGVTLCRSCHSKIHGRNIPEFPQPRRHYVKN